MKFKHFKIIAVLFSLLALASCSKYQKILKSEDMALKEEMALKYYNEKDYDRALRLFDELRIFNRGKLKAEEIAFYYAYCYYGLNDFYAASYLFTEFVNTFPNSKHAEECAFLAANCKFLESPNYNLDQSMSKAAIKDFQQFVNLYPTSKNVAEANANIDELRLKLQRKDFETAKLYLKTEEYKSAVIAFNNLIKEYPDTQYKEEALYLIVKTYYDYAGKSVVQKKYERYKATIDAAANFIQLFPESNKYNKEIEQISKSASKEILKFKPQNS